MVFLGNIHVFVNFQRLLKIFGARLTVYPIIATLLVKPVHVVEPHVQVINFLCIVEYIALPELLLHHILPDSNLKVLQVKRTALFLQDAVII